MSHSPDEDPRMVSAMLLIAGIVASALLAGFGITWMFIRIVLGH